MSCIGPPPLPRERFRAVGRAAAGHSMSRPRSGRFRASARTASSGTRATRWAPTRSARCASSATAACSASTPTSSGARLALAASIALLRAQLSCVTGEGCLCEWIQASGCLCAWIQASGTKQRRMCSAATLWLTTAVPQCTAEEGCFCALLHSEAAHFSWALRHGCRGSGLARDTPKLLRCRPGHPGSP